MLGNRNALERQYTILLTVLPMYLYSYVIFEIFLKHPIQSDYLYVSQAIRAVKLVSFYACCRVQ